ncbi:MAG: DUF3604 domain-containing protein [Pseudomonadales bacterium]|nr:DUF3604 domain-containing protein [Pseudomonadales bacterium]MCP5183757.1 DUF3604 domain-containing protein [Pseudomonadales bacterium]
MTFRDCLFGVVLGLLAVPAESGEYSPPVGNDYPTRVLFGDTHLHTRNSADAYSLGNMNLTPADAFRFARGEEVVAHNGMRVKLRRPLDFLVVSDHAEYLGGFYRYNVRDPLVANTEAGAAWKDYVPALDSAKMMGAFTGSIRDKAAFPPFPEDTRLRIWRDVALTADELNDPGRFTAFIGYEWTAMLNGSNLHRVVMFRDGADKASRVAPFSAQDSIDARDLWRALADYEAKTGGRVLAIGHNGNLSNGLMYADTTLDGKPLNRAYAELSARWEPLFEATQVKGDSETHPSLSPGDEFADFETWDTMNISHTAKNEPWMLKYEYARSVLAQGLKHERKLGVNPFKFGLIGSTDGHNALSTADEDNFFGKFPDSEPSDNRFNTLMANVLDPNWKLVASGLAAVWAKENTREAIFDAMQRKEVYATTGSRLQVRFFGGFSYTDDDLHQAAWLDTAYRKGVPMGGDLAAAPGGEAPAFLVAASRDPDGANLDRVQIVKGWMDARGELHEKVYDVAWAGDRRPDAATGKLPPVGNTVDVATASYTNTIGTAELAAVWRDPEFDAGQRAFYYARVLEIPTPRWSTYDARYFGVELPAEAPRSLQDRAYTSPIWYTP